MVTNLCKGFSNFYQSEALAYAQVDDLELLNDTAFLVGGAKAEDLSPAVDRIHHELTGRVNVFGMFVSHGSTMRDCVGLVLVHALSFFRKCQAR